MSNALHGTNDNSLGFLRQTRLEDLVRQHPAFSRLHRVYQTSGAYLTWPTMRTQRFEHSLGVGELAGRFFVSAVANADEGHLDEFYRHYQSAIVMLVEDAFQNPIPQPCHYPTYSDLQSQKRLVKQLLQENDSDSVFIRQHSFLIPSIVPEHFRNVHLMLVQAVRLAGLLHDVGHPPYSHVCEQILDTFFKQSEQRIEREQATHADFARYKGLETIRKEASETAEKFHEMIGIFLARRIFSDIAAEEAKRSDHETDIQYHHYYAIIGHITLAILKDQGTFADLHRIVAGTIDADRLDFVKRDRQAAGFTTNVDYTRILDAVKLFKASKDRENPCFVFAFPEKAIDPLVTLLTERFESYRRVIQHHNVVKSGALMREALAILESEWFATGAGEDSQPGDGVTIPPNISGLWHPFTMASYSDFDTGTAFAQWDDAWLNSVLIGEFAKSDSANRLHSILGELLYGEDHYHSLVKRRIDWKPFVQEFETFCSELVKKRYTFNEEAMLGKPYRDSLIKALSEIQQKNDTQILDAFAELYEELAKNNLAEKCGVDTTIENAIKTALNQYERASDRLHFDDVIVDSFKINDGLKEPVYLYNPERNGPEEWSTNEDMTLVGLREQAAVSNSYFIFIACDRELLDNFERRNILHSLARFFVDDYVRIGLAIGYLQANRKNKRPL